jgi:hypothetical protein
MRALAPILALGLIGLATPSFSPPLPGLAVDVANASEPVGCSEKDNVTVTFTSPETRRFRIETVHPAYLSALGADRREPDWTGCDFRPAQPSAPAPRPVTIYDDGDLRLIGYTQPAFWRSKDVPIQVGERIERGLDLIQLWVGRDGAAEEILAMYPGDGYWRIRPLSPRHLGSTAYGSSFLVGPVEIDGRPVVNIEAIRFDPSARRFRLAFVGGGSATIRLGLLDRERQALDVEFDPAMSGRPFAALRSMFVTETNADVARIKMRAVNEDGVREEPILTFGSAQATDAWMGRLVPSRHNTSAPDMAFTRFQGATPRPR